MPAAPYLTHIIKDANGNPLIDQTLHWAAPNQDCLDGTAPNRLPGRQRRALHRSRSPW